MEQRYTDKAQMQAISQGNEQAFRQLVEASQAMVYNTALGFLRMPADAEDLAQEVFIEVFRSAARYRGDASLRTWIYRITVSKALEHIRKHKRLKRKGILLNIFGKDDAGEPLPLKADDHPGISLEDQDTANALYAALAKLPEKQRTAWTLHKMEELSYQEVADVMKTSLPGVESLMHRARQALRKHLAFYYGNMDK